jgi:hypothetical protein
MEPSIAHQIMEPFKGHQAIEPSIGHQVGILLHLLPFLSFEKDESRLFGALFPQT